jgi:hypothetical protein
MTMVAITERVWLTENNRPEDLANFALRDVTDRRLRLFGLACCELVCAGLRDERCRRAVDVALRYADGLASADDLQAANAAAEEAADESWYAAGYKDNADTAALRLARNASSVDLRPDEGDGDGWQSFHAGGSPTDFFIWHTLEASPADSQIRAKITGLLRDVVGNPFRPAAAEKRWLAWKGGIIAKTARELYDGRAFEKLPSLADALEEAGCTDSDILAHCRGRGPHVRGCWVLDLILSKQ